MGLTGKRGPETVEDLELMQRCIEAWRMEMEPAQANQTSGRTDNVCLQAAVLDQSEISEPRE